MKTLIICCLTVACASIPSRATVEPAGGVQVHGYAPGTVVPIRWTNDFEAEEVEVMIWNADQSTMSQIAANINAAVGAYEWTVPTDIQSGNNYRFVVRDANNPMRFSMSSGWVSISNSAPLVAPTSVTSVNEARNITLHPFPASTNVTVEWQNGVVHTINVVDLQNRILLTQQVPQGSHRISLDVKDLAPGLSFVQLHAVGGAITSKPMMIAH